MNEAARKLGLEQHSPLIYRALPDQNAKPSTLAAPSAILVCGWMDAQLSHVYKYVEPYRRMFPHVPVIIYISTSYSSFLAGKREWMQSAEIVQGLLREAGDAAAARTPNQSPSVFVHAFSNGGLMSIDALLLHIKDASATFPQPVGTVFDSLPSSDGVGQFLSAASVGFTTTDFMSRLKYVLYMASAGTIYGWSRISHMLNGGSRTIDSAKKDANTPKCWAWQKGAMPLKCPPRLYLHSRVDEFIEAESVDKHAQELQQVNGEAPPAVVEGEDLKQSVATWPPLDQVRTRRMVWNTPKHVQIGRKFPQLYWSTIESFVREVMSMVPGPLKSRL